MPYKDPERERARRRAYQRRQRQPEKLEQIRAYHREWRKKNKLHGLQELEPKQIARFWDKVQQGDGCWLWSGGLDRDGYGRIGFLSGKFLAHRIAFELTYGPIPTGKVICHHCNNLPCVRPDHLYLTDQKGAIRKSIERGNQAFRRNLANATNARRLTQEDEQALRQAAGDGENLTSIAKRFGISWVRAKRIVSPRLPRNPRGENNNNAKLTWQQVAEIRTFYTQNRLSPAILAERFGVTPATIRDIARNETWVDSTYRPILMSERACDECSKIFTHGSPRDTIYVFCSDACQAAHRRRLGLCPYCGGPKNQNSAMCPKCREAHHKFRSTRRSTRRAAGLCVECGQKSNNPSGQYCSRCFERHREWERESRARARRCRRCGGPRTVRGVYCLECKVALTEERQQNEEERRLKEAEARKCPDCGAPVTQRGKRCSNCSKTYQKQAVRNRLVTRKAAGLCRCGNPREEPFTHCRRCRKRHKAYQRGPKSRERMRRWENERYKNDPISKLNKVMRAGFRAGIRQYMTLGKDRVGGVWDYIGLSPSKLLVHLKKLFQDGMSLENHGSKPGQWSIDHIIPVSTLRQEPTEAQIQKVWHYTNLRPLWHVENMRKGGVRNNLANPNRKRQDIPSAFIPLPKKVSGQRKKSNSVPLTSEDVQNIRQSLRDDRSTAADLAKQYKISTNRIWTIVARSKKGGQSTRAKTI